MTINPTPLIHKIRTTTVKRCRPQDSRSSTPASILKYNHSSMVSETTANSMMASSGTHFPPFATFSSTCDRKISRPVFYACLLVGLHFWCASNQKNRIVSQTTPFYGTVSDLGLAVSPPPVEGVCGISVIRNQRPQYCAVSCRPPPKVRGKRRLMLLCREPSFPT
jgi:hypothetical protein